MRRGTNTAAQRLARVLAISLGMVGLWGCGDRTREAETADTAARTDEPTVAADDRGTPGSEAGTAETGTDAELANLSDDEIKSVVDRLNQAEIQAADLAIERTSNPDVKKFAQTIRNEHTGMEQQTQGTAEQENIDADPNSISAQVRADAERTLQTLEAASGPQFDRAYIDSQVTMHGQALEIIDRLHHNADDPELQNLLAGAREKVQSHLQQAQQLQSRIAA